MKTVLLILLMAIRASAACKPADANRVAKAYESGKRVLVIAWTEKSKCAVDSEACGDWADRLNQFKASAGKNVEIIKIAPKRWPEVVSIGRKSVPEMSSLFLLKGKPAYFYEGPITELDVYTSVTDKWGGKNPPNGFLPPVVSFHVCK